MSLGEPLGANYRTSTTSKPTKKKPSQLPVFSGSFGDLNKTFQDPWTGGPLLPAQRPRPSTPTGPTSLTAYDAIQAQLDPINTQRSGYQRALDFFGTANQTQQDWIDFQRTQFQNQIGLLQGNQALQSRLLNEDYSTSLARLGLQGEGIGIDKEAIGREIAYYSNLLGLSEEDFKRTSGTLDTLGTLASEALALQLQGIGVDETSAKQLADVNTRQVLSDATARGAVPAPGTQQAFTDIQNQLVNQLEAFGINRKESERGFRELMTNLTERKGQLGTDFQRETLGLKNKQQQARDAEKQLGLRAKDLGLQKDQLRTALQQGLAKLNLDTVISIDELMGAIVGGDFKQQQIAEDIIRQATDAAGYFGSLPGGTVGGVQRLGANGQIDRSLLTPIGSGHYMHPVAASAWQRMVADAASQGVNITLTDSYRDLPTQERLVKQKGLYSQGGLAAKPGHSKHGDALAVDVDQGRDWLAKNGPRYGFKTIPDEPWHWEWAGGTNTPKAQAPKPSGKLTPVGKSKSNSKSKGNKGRAYRI